jgi:hypothetical protein
MSSQSDILPESSVYEQNRREAALFYCLFHKRHKEHLPENVFTQKENERIQSILNTIVSFVKYLGGLRTIIAFAGAITPFAVAYAVLVSAMYLLGYWNKFEFNIFDYLSLGDLITHAMSWSLSLILVILFIMLVSILSISWRIFWTVFLLALIGIWIWYLRTIPSVYVDFVVLMFLIYTPNRKLLIFKTTAAMFLVIHIPFSAYDAGQRIASGAKQGKGFRFVDLSKSGSQLPVDQGHRVSYLAGCGKSRFGR